MAHEEAQVPSSLSDFILNTPLPLPLSPTPVSRPLAISQTLQAFALTLSFCRIYLESYKKRLYFKKRHPHSSRTWAFSATPVSTEEAKSI